MSIKKTKKTIKTKKNSDLDHDLEVNLGQGDLEENKELSLTADDSNSFADSLINAKNDNASNEVINISKSKLILVKKLLDNIKDSNEKLIRMLSVFVSDEDESRISIGQASFLDDESMSEEEAIKNNQTMQGGKIIEGVFDGENMIGPDGKQYSMPANYASKSKLVEGDILKLTITATGTFVYKQIGPIERARVIGILEKDNDGNFTVKSDGKKWRVLPASVTYFKGGPGDEVVLLIPKSGESKWGAVENIIKNKE